MKNLAYKIAPLFFLVSMQSHHGYKTFSANLTQASTDAPVATIFQNDLGAVPVWGYTSAGIYTLTLAGAWVSAKTQVLIGAANALVTVALTSADVITITTRDAAAAVANGVLTNTPIEIRIWP